MRVRMVRNHRVLKLVHPGGFIEIHQNPITAHEVMKKNPRHCVTRPDVFRFPWIVVRPESVLNIGSVFYIVPFHTIRRLMQRKKCEFDNSLLLQQRLMDSSAVQVTYFHHLFKKQGPSPSETRRKVDFKIDCWPEDAIFPECLIKNEQNPDSCYDQESLVMSGFELELVELDDSPRKACSVDHWYTAFDYENYQESKQQAADNCFIEPRPSFSLDIPSNDVQKDRTFPKVEENKVLKSCLKKENNGRSHSFRVRFVTPEEDDEKINIEVFKFKSTKSP